VEVDVRAEQVTAACTEHGEGPVWDVAAGVLRFVDMLAGAVLTYDPVTSELTRQAVADVVAALRPRRSGGWVLGTARGFALVDDLREPEKLEYVEAFTDPAIRMNDGGCDPQGRFYCGSMAYSQEPGKGTLYRLDPDRSVHEVFADVTVSNGLCWTPDGSRALYVDSPTHRIDQLEFDPATGALRDRRPFVTIDEGTPDGLTIDSDGGTWVALYGAGVVHRYDQRGNLDLVVEVPVSKPTACAFVDRDLFITTTREGLPPDAEPQAGAVFHVRPGVRGLAPLPFAG
jgi:sugar lactone lactonase YvrE